jgi:hypothetical protein
MISLSLALVAWLASSQEGLDQLGVGHYIEVRGELTKAGRFVAEKVELLAPDSDVLIGTIAPKDHDKLRFHLLGQIVETDGDTSWKGLEDGVAGQRVKVEGSWKGPRKFQAGKVQSRGEGRDRIGGRINEWRRVEGGWEASVMIFTVVVPDGTELEHEDPIESYALAPERSIGVNDPFADMERDEDDAFGAGFVIAPGLRVTGQLEGKITSEQDYDLINDTRANEEDRTDFDFASRLRLVWTPSDKLWGLIEGRFTERYRRDENNGVIQGINSHGGNVGEAWLQWRDLNGWTGFDLTVGRQDFDDAREWLYDENLDAVRLTWIRPDWRLDLSGSKSIDGSPRNQESTNWIAYLSNNDFDKHLAVWTVYRDIGAFTERNTAIADEQSWHLGARVLGEWLPDNEVWFDFAYQLGEREGRNVSAWGYDAGTTWYPSFLDDWYLTGGYALGTGDRDSSGSNGNFRQTGFQDNNGSFGGVTSFRYYGELSDFELSNLGILTLGIGKILAPKTSLDLVYHTYTQDVPLPSFSARPAVQSNINQDPNGVNADLGSEIDLILGYRGIKNWDLEIVASRFSPGPGFATPDDAFDDNAYLAKIQLRYRF